MVGCEAVAGVDLTPGQDVAKSAGLMDQFELAGGVGISHEVLL